MKSLPRTFDEAGLREAGFLGFETIRSMRERRLSSVPSHPGVYAVLRSEQDAPRFLLSSTGGWFKGQDPSDPLAVLEKKWLTASTVVYIGKAGSETGAATLRTRLKQLLDFGDGKPVGHRGGRFLWHLSDSDRLLVCWRAAASPRSEEALLIAEFRRQHGALPFANMVG